MYTEINYKGKVRDADHIYRILPKNFPNAVF